jgi:hypothetical protein
MKIPVLKTEKSANDPMHYALWILPPLKRIFRQLYEEKSFFLMPKMVRIEEMLYIT